MKMSSKQRKIKLFHFRSVGMPSIRTVTVVNPHTEQNLQLQSISGSTAHFHASFFQTKVSVLISSTCAVYDKTFCTVRLTRNARFIPVP